MFRATYTVSRVITEKRLVERVFCLMGRQAYQYGAASYAWHRFIATRKNTS